MKRKSLKNDSCAVARSLDVVGDWWSLLIIRDAFDGVTRFCDFQRNLGVARNILSDRLQMLVANDVLQTSLISGDSGFSEYTLTKKGKKLLPVIEALRHWGEEFEFKKKERAK